MGFNSVFKGLKRLIMGKQTPSDKVQISAANLKQIHPLPSARVNTKFTP
jgi:hypothetical protein